MVDGEQESTVRLEPGDEGTELDIIDGKCLVLSALAAPIERDGMVLAFAKIDTNEAA